MSPPLEEAPQREATLSGRKNCPTAAERIRSILDKAYVPGSFAADGFLATHSLPNLVVDGTEFSVPFSPNDVPQIIAKSEKAPFGFGLATILDDAIRSTWQLDAQRLSLDTEEWTSILRHITRDAILALGKETDVSNVCAQPHKLLLYQEGDGFKPHRDSEKVAGMFGTLVIAISFEHVGGDVRVSHLLEEKTFKTDGLRPSDVYWMAWYSDVTHEIEPVRTGCRIVLTFNLVSRMDGAGGRPREIFQSQTNPLDEALRRWAVQEHSSPAFCYALDHKYTLQSLAPAGLKAGDMYRFQAAADACERAGGFYLMLAQIHMVVTRPSETETQKESRFKSARIALGPIMTAYGTVLDDWDMWKLDRDCIARLPAYPKNAWAYDYDDSEKEDRRLVRWPDSYTGGEFLGNENAEKNTVYTDTALLIIDKAQAIQFLDKDLRFTSPQFDTLQTLLVNAFDKTKDVMVRQLLEQVCHERLDAPYGSCKSKDAAMGQVATGAMIIAEYELWESATRNMVEGFDEASFTRIGGIISSGRSQLDISHPRAWSQCLRTPTLTRLWRSLCAYRDGYMSELKASYDPGLNHRTDVLGSLSTCIQDYISGTVPSITQVLPEDASTVLEIVAENGRCWHTIAQPFIERHSDDSAFMNALRIEVFTFPAQYDLPDAIRSRLDSLIAQDCVKQFGLKDYLRTRNHRVHPHKPAHNVESLKQLYLAAKAQGPSGADTVLHHIAEQAKEENVSAEEFDAMLAPFMHRVLSSIDDVTLPSTVAFYHSMVTSYVQRVVLVRRPHRYDTWPDHDDDWSRPEQAQHLRPCPRHRECVYCQQTAAFLLDPTRFEFQVPRDGGYMHSFDLAGDGCYVYDDRQFCFDLKKISRKRDRAVDSFEALIELPDGPDQIKVARTFLSALLETCRGREHVHVHVHAGEHGREHEFEPEHVGSPQAFDGQRGHGPGPGYGHVSSDAGTDEIEGENATAPTKAHPTTTTTTTTTTTAVSGTISAHVSKTLASLPLADKRASATTQDSSGTIDAGGDENWDDDNIFGLDTTTQC